MSIQSAKSVRDLVISQAMDPGPTWLHLTQNGRWNSHLLRGKSRGRRSNNKSSLWQVASRLRVFNSVSSSQVLKTASQKNNDKGVESVLTFKVTSDIKAFCNASNKHGTDMVVFSIKTSESLLRWHFLSRCFVYKVCTSLSCPPLCLFLSVPTLHVSLSFYFIFVWMPQAASCVVMCRLWLWTFLISVVVSDVKLVRLLNVPPSSPSVLTGSFLPSVLSNCFQLHTPPHQPPPLPIPLPLPFPPPQVRPSDSALKMTVAKKISQEGRGCDVIKN